MQYRREAPITTSGLTELRIHGVGGTTPEALLGVPYTELVAGDSTAGFFAAPDWIPVEGPADVLEGYSWGGITSAARLRALWLLLLPFAMVNLAGWMFPHAGSATEREPRVRRRSESFDVWLLRALGLAMTAAMTAFIAFILVVIGSLSRSNTWLRSPWRWVADWSNEGAALGGAMAMAVVLVIAYLTKRSQTNPVGMDLRETQPDPAFRLNLRDPGLWTSTHVAHRLGLIHTAVATAVSAALGTQFVNSVADLPVLRWLMGWHVAIIVLGLVAVARIGRIGDARLLLLLGGSIAGAIVSFVAMWTSDARDLGEASMRGPLLIVAGAVIALFLTMWLMALLRRSTEGDADGGPGGDLVDDSDGAPARSAEAVEASMPVRIALPFLALLIIAALGSGLAVQAARLLSVPISLGELEIVSVMGFVWVALVVAVTAYTFASTLGYLPWRAAAPIQNIAARYPDGDAASDPGFLRRVRRAEASARVTDAASTILTFPAVVAALGGAGLMAAGWEPPAWLLASTSWALSALPLAVLFLIQSSWRDRDTRRRIAVVWDVMTFWPRWFHPWAPPSYGERAVPHLRRRIDKIGADGGATILSAHSQGTVVAVAALAMGDPCANVRLITHGSPLNRLYARYFPEYFDQALFADVANDLGQPGEPSWRNLWRLTDFIGGPVFEQRHAMPDMQPAGTPDAAASIGDIWIRDPEQPDPPLGGDPRPRPSAHSDYYVTTRYGVVRNSFAVHFHSTEVEVDLSAAETADH